MNDFSSLNIIKVKEWVAWGRSCWCTIRVFNYVVFVKILKRLSYRCWLKKNSYGWILQEYRYLRRNSLKRVLWSTWISAGFWGSVLNSALLSTCQAIVNVNIFKMSWQLYLPLPDPSTSVFENLMENQWYCLLRQIFKAACLHFDDLGF